uniref:Mediator complex subunit 15 n=1 Tax=Ascaris lumbricoides TaxID=6252 RepID=A0A0M3IKA5_ASCLU
MEKGKAPGIDGLTGEMLKLEKELLVTSLKSLFNNVIKYQQIPEDFAFSKPKKGNPDDIRNYRPCHSYQHSQSSMEKGKAPGIDGLTGEMLKLEKELLVTSLKSLFNNVIKYQQVPEDFAFSKPKKGNPDDIRNYRSCHSYQHSQSKERSAAGRLHIPAAVQCSFTARVRRARLVRQGRERRLERTFALE